MRCKCVLIVCLLFPFILKADPSYNIPPVTPPPCNDLYIPPFALITVPKSGSHLVIKTLYLLTGGIPLWHTRFPCYQYVPGNVGFLYTHFCVSPELESNYRELPNLKKIILVRDLRDVAISIVHQIKKSLWPGLTSQERQTFLQMSFDQQLLFVINFEYDVHSVAKLLPNSSQASLVRVAEQAVQYSQDPNILTLRYEDMVGPNGGGDLDTQLDQIHRICTHLHLHHSDTFLHEVAASLYGDTVNPFGSEDGFQNFQSTFRSGTTSRWKTLFTPAHKTAFKKKLGKALIALGYEQDDSW